MQDEKPADWMRATQGALSFSLLLVLSALSEEGLQVYRRRVGSALEGESVIDYTMPGSQASRRRHWDKLRTMPRSAALRAALRAGPQCKCA